MVQVQEAKAPLAESAAAISRSVESIVALFKKRLGDTASLKPTLSSATSADLSAAFSQKVCSVVCVWRVVLGDSSD
jgi:hypothetical protein